MAFAFTGSKLEVVGNAQRDGFFRDAQGAAKEGVSVAILEVGVKSEGFPAVTCPMQASSLLIYLVLSLIVRRMGYYSAYLMAGPERTLQN